LYFYDVTKFLTKISGAQATLLSFFLAFVLGSLAIYVSEHLLHGNPLPLIDAAFIAMSALCVTGLTSIDFGTWHTVSQVITLLLIQIGGLGIIFFTVILGRAVAEGLSKSTQLNTLLADVLDVTHQGVWNLIFSIVRITFGVEIIGWLVLWWHLSPSLGSAYACWWGLFHAVSAFCNAGFALFSDNLVQLRADWVVNLTVAGLIIVGGIGYPVILLLEKQALTFVYRFLYRLYVRAETRLLINGESSMERLTILLDRVDFFINRHTTRLQGVASVPQMIVALIGTATLLTAGTVVGLVEEWTNPQTLGSLSGSAERTLTAFFQSVSTRTAGFNTIDIGALRISTLFFYTLLMYVGACPQGTAGGLKIPTVFVLGGYLRSFFADQPRVSLLRYIISKVSVAQSVRLYFLSTTFIALVTFCMTIFNEQHLFLQSLFEVVSAFGTVGLSMGITTSLSVLAKCTIILTMYAGRVGLLTCLSALRHRPQGILVQLGDDGEKIQVG
jgi:trk system potassium uptake protein TrkH